MSGMRVCDTVYYDNKLTISLFKGESASFNDIFNVTFFWNKNPYLAVRVGEGQDDDVDDGGEETAHALAAAVVADVLLGEVGQVGHHTA